MRSFPIFAQGVLLVILKAASINGHMEMIKPCPRFNANGIDCPALPEGIDKDYNENSPISSKGVALQPFCKYATPWPTPAAIWTAGETVTVQFNTFGSPHSGGHCEWSLSYDGGQTFVVVHRELRHCFYDTENNLQTVYNFTLPADLPGSDNAIFAWSWVNAMGNREFYMNCADIVIKGSSSSYTGQQMTVLNYPGYPTVPEFLGNYDTGIDYYNNATSITVYAPDTASQSSDPPPQSSSPASPYR